MILSGLFALNYMFIALLCSFSIIHHKHKMVLSQDMDIQIEPAVDFDDSSNHIMYAAEIGDAVN